MKKLLGAQLIDARGLSGNIGITTLTLEFSLADWAFFSSSLGASCSFWNSCRAGSSLALELAVFQSNERVAFSGVIKSWGRELEWKEEDGWRVWFCHIFRQMVEFQWFLMALSVRPGRYFEMRAHLLPYLG